jgi:hypothetical protein
MPNSMGDFLQRWWLTNGEDVYCISQPTSSLPRSAIRAHVHEHQQYSPENQLEVIRQYAALHGMEIVQAY